jgi:hypothetical protein
MTAVICAAMFSTALGRPLALAARFPFRIRWFAGASFQLAPALGRVRHRLTSRYLGILVHRSDS